MIDTIVGWISGFYTTYIKPEIDKAVGFVGEIYDKHIKPVVDKILGFVGDIYDKHVKPVIDKVIGFFGEMYDKYIKPIIDPLINKLGELYDKYLKPIVDPIFKWIKDIYDEYVKPIFGKIVDLFGKLKTAFWNIFEALAGSKWGQVLLKAFGVRLPESYIKQAEEKRKQRENASIVVETKANDMINQLNDFVKNDTQILKLQKEIEQYEKNIKSGEDVGYWEDQLKVAKKGLSDFTEKQNKYEEIKDNPLFKSLNDTMRNKLKTLNKTSLTLDEKIDVIEQVKKQMNNSNDINKEIYIEKLEEMSKTLNERLQKMEKKQEKTLASANTAAQVGAVAAGASIAGAQKKESVLVETPSSNYNLPGFFYQNYNW